MNNNTPKTSVLNWSNKSFLSAFLFAAILSLSLTPTVFAAPQNEEPEDDYEYEEEGDFDFDDEDFDWDEECDHDEEDWEDYDDDEDDFEFDFAEEKEFIMEDLQLELSEVEDTEVVEAVTPFLDKLQVMEDEDAFWDLLDEAYEVLDQHWESLDYDFDEEDYDFDEDELEEFEDEGEEDEILLEDNLNDIDEDTTVIVIDQSLVTQAGAQSNYLFFNDLTELINFLSSIQLSFM
jgi:hypothetical protein